VAGADGADTAPEGDAGVEADAGGPRPENSATDTEEEAGDSDEVPGSGEAGTPADDEGLPEDDEAEEQVQAVGLTPEPGRT
jgi:hypothetical protein